jgi:hypothetical protein
VRTFGLARTAMKYRTYPATLIDEDTGEPVEITGMQILWLPVGDTPSLSDETDWSDVELVTGGGRVLYAGPDVPTNAVGYEECIVMPAEGRSVHIRVVDAPERLPEHVEDVIVF